MIYTRWCSVSLEGAHCCCHEAQAAGAPVRYCHGGRFKALMKQEEIVWSNVNPALSVTETGGKARRILLQLGRNISSGVLKTARIR